MDLYQYLKITGVAFKLLFPEGTTPEATPVQWALGYSNVETMLPELPLNDSRPLQPTRPLAAKLEDQLAVTSKRVLP